AALKKSDSRPTLEPDVRSVHQEVRLEIQIPSSREPDRACAIVLGSVDGIEDRLSTVASIIRSEIFDVENLACANYKFIPIRRLPWSILTKNSKAPWKSAPSSNPPDENNVTNCREVSSRSDRTPNQAAAIRCVGRERVIK